MEADSTHTLERPPSGMVALFDAHRGELLRFLRARCGDPAEAEDLAQELWIKLSVGTTGPIAQPRAYLFRCANNLVLDHRRAQQRAMARDRAWLGAQGRGDHAPELSADPAPDAEEQLNAREEARILNAAIDALPPGAARALRLHRIDGLPQAEVARQMGISRSGVEKHLVTALRHLRRILVDEHQLDCGSFSASASKGQTPTDGSNIAEHRP